MRPSMAATGLSCHDSPTVMSGPLQGKIGTSSGQDQFYQVSVFMVDTGQQNRDNMMLLAQPPWGQGSCKTCPFLLDNTDYHLLQMMSRKPKGYKSSSGVVY